MDIYFTFIGGTDVMHLNKYLVCSVIIAGMLVVAGCSGDKNTPSQKAQTQTHKMSDVAASEISMLENKYSIKAQKIYSEFTKEFTKYKEEASKHNNNIVTKNKLDDDMRAKCQSYIKQISALSKELRPIKFSAYVEDAAFSCYAFLGSIKSEIANIDDILSYHAPTDSEVYWLAQTLHEHAVSDYYHMTNEFSKVKTGKPSYQINNERFNKVRNGMTYFELINLFEAPDNTYAEVDPEHEIHVWELGDCRYDITLKDGVVSNKETRDKQYIELAKTINTRIKASMEKENGHHLNYKYVQVNQIAAADDKIKNTFIYESRFYTQPVDEDAEKDSKEAKDTRENNIKLANAIAKWAPEYGLKGYDALKYVFGETDAKFLVEDAAKNKTN